MASKCLFWKGHMYEMGFDWGTLLIIKLHAKLGAILDAILDAIFNAIFSQLNWAPGLGLVDVSPPEQQGDPHGGGKYFAKSLGSTGCLLGFYCCALLPSDGRTFQFDITEIFSLIWPRTYAILGRIPPSAGCGPLKGFSSVLDVGFWASADYTPVLLFRPAFMPLVVIILLWVSLHFLYTVTIYYAKLVFVWVEILWWPFLVVPLPVPFCFGIFIASRFRRATSMGCSFDAIHPSPSCERPGRSSKIMTELAQVFHIDILTPCLVAKSFSPFRVPLFRGAPIRGKSGSQLENSKSNLSYEIEICL